MTTTNTETSTKTETRLIGMVKWFNKKSGYGFITVLEGDVKGKDIFVHYSTLRVSNSHYKYLVQGEYIEFVLEKSLMEGHVFQASDVSGVMEGPLMCETVFKNIDMNQSKGPRKYGPRDDDEDDFTPVVVKKNNYREKSYSVSVMK